MVGRDVSYPAYENWLDLLGEAGGELSWVLQKRTFPLNTSNKKQPTQRTLDEIRRSVLASSRVQSAMQNETLRRGCASSEVLAEAEEMLDIMAHKYSLNYVRPLGYAVSKVLRRLFDGIYVNTLEAQRVRKVCQESPVVFMPTHRTYLDFLLLSLVCFQYEIPLPAIAAGMDFMNSAFMGAVLRRNGAFFMRRSFGKDALYWAVFTEYVQTHLVHSDRPVEFFVEATRSRVGKSLHPKYGLLQILVEPYIRGNVYDITVVPVSMNYDKILEEMLYAYELLGFPKPKESTSGLFKAREILDHNFGKCFITFGDPISLRDYFGTSLHRSSFVCKKSSPLMKKPRLSEEDLNAAQTPESANEYDDTTAMDSFTPTLPSNSKKVKRVLMPRALSVRDTNEYPMDFSALAGNDWSSSPSFSSPTVTTPILERTSNTVPQDLRLGTRLRITSKVPFPWMKNAKSTGNIVVRTAGTEKFDGLKEFVQKKEGECPLNLPASLTANSLLESGSLYWQFPNMPWLPLFPRIDSLMKTMPRQTAPPLAPSMIDVINKQWVECFERLFHSWKTGDRKRFYVACPTFSVLFTKCRETEDELLDDSVSCFQTTNGLYPTAIITPTNMGFRQYLKSEGVEFELCSWKKRRLSKTNVRSDDASSACDDLSRMSTADSLDSVNSNPGTISSSARRVSFGIGTEIEPEDKDDKPPPSTFETSDSDESPSKKENTGTHDWLTELGVSPRNTMKLRRHNSMVATASAAPEKKSKADKEETGSVVVKGSSVQTLYNLLQSSPRNVRAIAGPHANLPPTLLAATPFLYGQLMGLKKSSQVVKKTGQTMEYILELDGGPIMNHTVEAAVLFARKAGLCAADPVKLRVNDRAACAGLNGVEADTEWAELTVREDDLGWSG